MACGSWAWSWSQRGIGLAAVLFAAATLGAEPSAAAAGASQGGTDGYLDDTALDNTSVEVYLPGAGRRGETPESVSPGTLSQCRNRCSVTSEEWSPHDMESCYCGKPCTTHGAVGDLVLVLVVVVVVMRAGRESHRASGRSSSS
jgi:hypothetical protein